MKPERFSIGQEVTLAFRPRKAKEVGSSQFCIPFGPRFGVIYHVKDYQVSKDGAPEWYIGLMEIDKWRFSESAFAPVVADSVINSEIEEALKELELV